MSLIKWLFGKVLRVEESAPGAIRAPNAKRERDWLRLREHDFFGQCVKSPNGRHTLAWCDGQSDDSGHLQRRGRYLLLTDDQVVVDGKMDRPHDGKIADNGVFILNDWGSSRSLSGSFCAFRATGGPILIQKFKANLLGSGLSEDGRYAACHTANADDDHDAAVFATFDLARGTEIARWHPESGWPSKIDFPVGKETVQLTDPHLGAFRYSLTGAFLDRQLWQEACLGSEHHWYPLRMAESLIEEANGKPSSELALKLIPHLDRVLANIDDKFSKARVLRARGTCQEATGALASAIDAYEKALTLDPKVGVKRRLTQLKKTVDHKGGSRA